ncbi:PspC domain-containing protein [Streptosporangiaceae bacterium NEAU-GS5]|nr:PspC domain-containing protein [Streptosporangiaceae bacterium NEAU-GS5]
MNSNGSVKQLRRTKDGRIVGGVCSGVGDYLGVDPNILRVALAVATLFGGFGVGVYAVAWLLVPEEGSQTSIVQDLISKNKDNPTVQDIKTRSQEAWAKATHSQSSYSAPGSYTPPARPTDDDTAV